MELEQNFEETKRFYDTNINIWINNQRNNVREQYLKLFPNDTSCYILDVGCGCGFDIQKLAIKNFKGIGIDFSKEAINYAKELNKKTNWKFYQVDFRYYDPKELYDCVLFSMVIMHYSDLYNIFSCLNSFLKKNGVLIVVTNNPFLVCNEYQLPYQSSFAYMHRFIGENGSYIDSRKYIHTLSSYIKEANNAGFQVEKIEEITSYELDTKVFNRIFVNYFPNFIAFRFKKIL